MAKPPIAPSVTPKPLIPSSSANVFLPESVGPDDFFRMRRKGNGWIVQMVRVSSEHARQDVWEWDLSGGVMRRLIDLAMQSEKKR